MARIEKHAYRDIIAVKSARRFDAGTFLMRLFVYTTSIGTITMLTLAGASTFEATTVSSLIAVFTFVVAPRVSKLIDERGQSTIVPPAAAIGLAGMALLLAVTQFSLPFWLNYLAAPLISCLPNAQAIARARWGHLIESGALGNAAIDLKTTYAYEGVLEDIAFMIGPAAAIALSAAIAPAAGMFAGTILYASGTVMLLSSKETEPPPSQSAHPTKKAGTASVLRTYPAVRVLFVVMVLMGATYGAFDATIVSYAESIDFPMLASATFALESVLSVILSAIFGMIVLALAVRRQFTLFACVFGVLYGLLILIDSPVSALVISCISGMAYPLLFITTNLAASRAVPVERLTESITWVGAGLSIGMIVGPVSAGALIDATTPLVGFDLAGGFAIAIIAVALLCIPVLRKHLP